MNPNNFVRFQYFLPKFCIHVSEIKQIFHSLHAIIDFKVPFYKICVKNLQTLSKLGKKTRDITLKNSLFRTSNLNYFVSFQYFLLKFGLHVHEIKIHFLFSSYYHKLLKIKKLFRKKNQFFTIFLIFCNFLPIWNPYDFLTFYWILLKLGMLIPPIALNFSYFQCCNQLFKAKKFYKKI